MICLMGSGRSTPSIPDLFSTTHREAASLLATSSPPTADNAASSPRHVLPGDLPAAIKQLSDQELDQLQTALTAEIHRRGKKPPAHQKAVYARAESQSVSLTPGKLSAVRAAYKAGVTPAKIARQFGIPQSDVRKVLASK
jgi:hypothetical protein